jgi:hypothetical protein
VLERRRRVAEQFKRHERLHLEDSVSGFDDWQRGRFLRNSEYVGAVRCRRDIVDVEPDRVDERFVEIDRLSVDRYLRRRPVNQAERCTAAKRHADDEHRAACQRREHDLRPFRERDRVLEAALSRDQ